MTTRKNEMLTSENSKEVSTMSTIQIPKNKTYFKQWSLFITLPGGTTVAYREDGTAYDKPKAFTLKRVPLTDLRKYKGYEQFADLANKLYRNYTPEGYAKFFQKFQAFNDRRQFEFNAEFEIRRFDWICEQRVKELALHYGEIPEVLFRLNDKQVEMLLDRARIKYDLVPEYIELQTKEIYRMLPKQLVKDVDEFGDVTYYSQEELDKAGYEPTEFVDVLGKFKFHSAKLNRIAELAVIRDARWMAQFDDTVGDLRVYIETADDDYEMRMQQALTFVSEHKNEYPAKELIAMALHLFDLDAKSINHNLMIPVTSFETFERQPEIESRDFLCDVYGIDEYGDIYTSHKKFQWSSED